MNTLLKKVMSNYYLELVVFRHNNQLQGVLYAKDYDNTIDILCENEDLSFWLKDYKFICNRLDENYSLYLYFTSNICKGLIYNNLEEKIIHEANGLNLKSCLNNLDTDLRLNIVRKKKWNGGNENKFLY